LPGAPRLFVSTAINDGYPLAPVMGEIAHARADFTEPAYIEALSILTRARFRTKAHAG
jgi:hypothetical protein